VEASKGDTGFRVKRLVDPALSFQLRESPGDGVHPDAPCGGEFPACKAAVIAKALNRFHDFPSLSFLDGEKTCVGVLGFRGSAVFILGDVVVIEKFLGGFHSMVSSGSGTGDMGSTVSLGLDICLLLIHESSPARGPSRKVTRIAPLAERS